MLTLKKTHYIVLGCFFFSGMASLIYQVLWVRQLGLVFGNTLHSVSTVLAVFMAGNQGAILSYHIFQLAKLAIFVRHKKVDLVPFRKIGEVVQYTLIGFNCLFFERIGFQLIQGAVLIRLLAFAQQIDKAGFFNVQVTIGSALMGPMTHFACLFFGRLLYQMLTDSIMLKLMVSR